MGEAINIRVGNLEIAAKLNNSPTAVKIYENLPIQGSVNTWGDEIYFKIPVAAPLDETARDVVEIGDLGYWPTGAAFCIFFGLTPASQGEEIRPASAVNVFGRVIGETEPLKKIRDGEKITVEKA